jgi:hypothetical protein
MRLSRDCHCEKRSVRACQIPPSTRLRDLCKTPLFAQFLRQPQILILKILNVFLWLKFSPSLNLNKNEHFSKVSLHLGLFQNLQAAIFFAPRLKGIQVFQQVLAFHPEKLQITNADGTNAIIIKMENTPLSLASHVTLPVLPVI